MNTQRVNWKKSRASVIFFIVVLLIFTAMNLGMTAPYLVATLMGAIISVLSNPFYRRLRERGLKESIASALVTVGITVLVLGPIALFTFAAVKQAISIGESISESQDLSFGAIADRISNWEMAKTLIGDPAALERQLRGGLQNAARTGSTMLLGVVGSIPELLLQGALALLTCFFMLIDGKRFVKWIMEKLPLEPDVQVELIDTFKNTSVSVIWATLAAAGVQAAIMFIAYLVLGVPASFLAGGATFIFAWIPVVGSVPVWVVGCIYLYAQGSIAKAVIMLVFGLVTGVADNFVRPLVLKGRGEMHPLVSLIAIFGGINWFGIMGVFIGPLLASVLIALLEIWPTVAKRGHLDADMPPPVATTEAPK